MPSLQRDCCGRVVSKHEIQLFALVIVDKNFNAIDRVVVPAPEMRGELCLPRSEEADLPIYFDRSKGVWRAKEKSGGDKA